jgi:hypothetical protein
MLSIADKGDLLRSYKDAATKVAALSARIKDESDQADAEGREPVAIQPLTPVKASLLVNAIDSIREPGQLAAIASSQRRACADLGDRTVYLLSEHLKALLDAAGIAEA